MAEEASDHFGGRSPDGQHGVTCLGETVTVKGVGLVFTLAMGSALDIATVPGVRSRLTEVLDRDEADYFVLSFHCTEFVDSSGLAFLVHFNRQIKARGRRMILCSFSHQARRTLSASNLHRLFEFAGSIEEAQAVLLGTKRKKAAEGGQA